MIPIKSISAAACFLAFLSAETHAVVVFRDDFTAQDGTAIEGRTPPVGTYFDVGGGPLINGNAVETAGGGRRIFGLFTESLSVGKVLTLEFETLETTGAFFSGGWSGVSLFVGSGSEPVFLGDRSSDSSSWAMVQGGVLSNMENRTNEAARVLYTYEFDSGAWTLSVTDAAGNTSLNGFTDAGRAFDRVRMANGSGGDIKLNSWVVDISPVPEPSTALLALGSLVALRRRRR